jgi:adenine-specific DNA methylase
MRSLGDADLAVTAVQPIQGEMSTSVTKYGTEASNLDSVVVCRKRDSLPGGQPIPTSEDAAAEGYAKLADLHASGIKVGAGDVRSVIRGNVLAMYTQSPKLRDIESLAAEADQLAQLYVDKILAED